jgi:hypothetical protein
MRSSSPWRSTSNRSSVFTGDLAWHSAARNVVKSCLPRRRDDLARALAARDRTACGPVAPPQGLYLVRVDY